MKNAVPYRPLTGSKMGPLGIALALGGTALPVVAAASPRARSAHPAMRGRVGPDDGPRWPSPLAARTFLRVRLKYARGILAQLKLDTVTYPRIPKRSRIVGRFLAEIRAGKQLLDVVPFNFPLLAPAETFTRTGAAIAARMESNLVTATQIEVPWLPTVDRVLIRDVATGRQWPLDLSPVRPKATRPATEPRPRSGETPNPRSEEDRPRAAQKRSARPAPRREPRRPTAR